MTPMIFWVILDIFLSIKKKTVGVYRLTKVCRVRSGWLNTPLRIAYGISFLQKTFYVSKEGGFVKNSRQGASTFQWLVPAFSVSTFR